MSARWIEIADSLRASIHAGNLLPGERLASETELAEQWQVCRMTAHRVMDELQREGMVVRRRRAGTFVALRVAAEAESGSRADLAQSSDADADSRSTAGSGAIALLFSYVNNLPQADYIQGIRSALPDERSLLYCDTGNNPEREAQHLARFDNDLSGVIAYPTCAPENTSRLLALSARGIPIVCVDRSPEGWTGTAVVTDNYASTLDALRSLTARGHRRIVFMGYEEEQFAVSSTRERREAFTQALQEVSENPDRWLLLMPRALGHNLPQMVDVVTDLLRPLCQGGAAPTALFCKDDFVLAAVLEACDRLCIAIPDDMEILSFSDYPPMTLRHSQAVHRLVQQSQFMGKIAAERLISDSMQMETPGQIIRVPALFHSAHIIKT